MIERERLLMVISGRKGIGKTYQTMKKEIAEYITTNHTTGKKGGKVLIFDTNNEYTNEQVKKTGSSYTIKKIALKDIHKYSALDVREVRRVIPINPNGTAMDDDEKAAALVNMIKSFRRGLLIIDDINTYITDPNYAEAVMKTIVNNRHRGQDIIITFQSLARVSTKLWQNSNIFKFHYQYDDTYRYKGRISPYEMFEIAEQLVKDKYYSGDIRFFVYIEKDKFKIFGNYSKIEFITACYKFIAIYPTLVSRTIRSENLSSNKAAMDYLIQKKYSMFYGGN